MKNRLFALALVLCLALSLCACGVNTDNVPSSPEVDPGAENTVTPDGEPSDVIDPSDAPEVSDVPEGEVGTDPIETQPAEEPKLEATEDKTAAELYAMWLTTSEQSPSPNASLVDMSAYLSEFYDLDKGDLENFVFYQPDMSSTLQEVFLAKAKSGKVNTVKAAAQGRLEALREEAKFYTGTGNYVDGAKLETVGDWVILAACPENDRLVKILKDAVK